METKLIATHLQLQHGDTILVIGRCRQDAKGFVVNLGQDCENVILHFNTRFNYQKDVNAIVCNFKKLGKWGAEERLNVFPFEQGGKVKISFTFLTSEIKVLAEGHEFTFPNRLDLDVISYIAVQGDINLRVLKLAPPRRVDE
ncbi:16 kDa beta-galactoside-binding lectin-like [Zootoca vivipara]|uniref:16 kDa beta-galactoside-binding lectin-like n=1 Tax=Zootoca vivipara TaxID=8524 RepID=UPI0015903AF7|nr:16 kDa beta-galactoside-binding lectin-like [Zootoca vivipara]